MIYTFTRYIMRIDLGKWLLGRLKTVIESIDWMNLPTERADYQLRLLGVLHLSRPARCFASRSPGWALVRARLAAHYNRLKSSFDRRLF